jgi:peroxiredoxin
LQQSLPEIKALGAELVTISPQMPDNSLTTAEKLALEFEVLSDAGNKVARQFGLVFKLSDTMQEIYRNFGIDLPAVNGDQSFELPVPATYVVDKNGIITYAFIDADYTKRLDPEIIVEELQKLNPLQDMKS